jgi:opacity protein-like surface antigen
MVKKTALTLFVAVIALTANAQKLRFGVKGGLNFSKETQGKVEQLYISSDLSFRTSFHIGGVMNYALTDQLELEADLLYSQQGYKDIIYTTAIEQNIANENYTVTSHYINLPIAIKYYIADGFYAECGPQIGYLLSKKGELENWENTYDAYSSNNTKKIDFGIFGGLGYRFNSNVFIEGRYIHGLTGTSKVVDGCKNRNIQISLGYLF